MCLVKVEHVRVVEIITQENKPVWTLSQEHALDPWKAASLQTDQPDQSAYW